MGKRFLKKVPGAYWTLNGLKLIFDRFLFMAICIIKDVDQKKIVFESFNGKSYSCNPRAVSEELYDQYPDFKIVWLFLDPDEKKSIVPDYVKRVRKKSFKAFLEIYTAKYWVDNFNKPKHTLKRKRQEYIQTWHGDRAFKKILFDSGSYKNLDKERFVENKICNVMTTGSTFGEKLLTSGFKYNGTFLKHGSPRNDCLLKKDEIQKEIIKQELCIDYHTQVVLFAPTYRNDYKKDKQEIPEINLPQIINKLNEKYQNNWICLTRSHSNADGLTFNHEVSKDIIDVSDYEDMRDLLLISDMLITDYSSSAGDFVIKEQPIILFQPDRQEYIENDRAFYIPIEETPFLVADNQKKLLDIISRLDDEMVKRNCKEIMKFYGFYETGRASEKVVEYIQYNTTVK